MKAQQSTASANVSHFIIEATQLNAQKKIWVYLPEGYFNTDRRFPVLYMHDGQNLFDRNTSYGNEWRADEVLDSLQAEVIVIGIEHGNDKRIDELTPFSNEKHGGGGADLYLEFIVSALKPYVDNNYRTKADKEHTTIMGSSLGGLSSYYATLKYPKIFGKAGVFSPSFWWSEDIFDLTINTDSISGKIYFMAGDHESRDMVPDLDRMIELIKPKLKSDKQIHVKISRGGRHDEELWSKEFAEALLWLMG